MLVAAKKPINCKTRRPLACGSCKKVGEENEKVVLNASAFVLVSISYQLIMKKKSRKLLSVYEVVERLY